MAEDNKKPNPTPTKVVENNKPGASNISEPAKKFAPKPFGGKKKFGGKRKPFRRDNRPKDDFEQKIVDLTRVTRVMAGGKRMKFRACMVIGDKKGKVGVGIAKGVDVAMAIQKSVTKARKNLITVPILDGTVPHEINIKKGASRLMIKPGRKGSGIKAGGVMRIVLELAGVKDAVAKILGTNNKVNNAKACSLALQAFFPAAKTTAKHQAPAHKKLEEKK